jgi:hypothetical protein
VPHGVVVHDFNVLAALAGLLVVTAGLVHPVVGVSSNGTPPPLGLIL